MTAEAFYALSDEERDYWIADWELRQMECPDCHGPRDECADPKKDWYPFRVVCYKTMAQEAVQAQYAGLHKDEPFHDGTFTRWSSERTFLHPFHFDAGVSVAVADHDVHPWDDFTSEKNASPVPPLVAEQAPGEESEAADDAAEERGEGDE